MKKNMDEKLSELIQKDRIGIPDSQIEDRLMYTFMLKNGMSNLRQNSFAGFLGWIFSFKSFGVKTAIISCLLVVTMMNVNIQQNQKTTGDCDSTFVDKALVLDTTRLSHELNTK